MVALQNDQELARKARPAFAENQIVGVLNAQAGRAANQVEGIEQLLDVEKSDIPGVLLGGESGFEGIRGTLMSSAGVVENDGQFAQDLPCLVCGRQIVFNCRRPMLAALKSAVR